MDLLVISVYISLFIQIITGIINYYVLQLKVPENFEILRELIILELIVQIIEGTFYIWLALNITNITNITPNRYYDWYITTPTMLITLCVYLIYLRNKQENNINNESLIEIVYQNIYLFSTIIFLNFVMLTFGYLAELKKLTKYVGVFLGFIPFLIYFYLIYDNFAKYSIEGLKIYWFFFIVWSLYGIAALMNYKIKNIMYNILDLFAKNFFGIFLAILIYSAQ